MTEDDEGSGYCIPPEHKDRLIKSYDQERRFWRKRLEVEGENMNPDVRQQLEYKLKVAEENLKDAESLPTCEYSSDEDVETPAQLEEPTARAPEPDAHTPQQH